MSKQLYSDMTVLCYLSHMDLLPQGQSLYPQIGDVVKAMYRFFELLTFKGTYTEFFLMYINP